MKKLITLCTAAVAIVLGYGSMNAYKTVENNNLLAENVEALSQETETKDFEYPNGYPYRSICNVQIGKNQRCKVEVITCQGGGSGCNSKKCPVHPAW